MVYKFTDETTLKRDIRAGEKAAFEYIFNYYYSDLCVYTTNFTSDPEAAEDIVQEIFVQLWNNRERTLITTSLKSYLYRSCYNRFIDSYRKNKMIQKNLEELRYVRVQEIIEEDPTVEEQRIERMNQLIDDLPPKCREVFLLSKIGGLKYKEIADKMNVSVKTIEYQVSKAYRRLREALNSPSEVKNDDSDPEDDWNRESITD